MGEKTNEFLNKFTTAVEERFNLHVDKADENEVVASITKNSDFVGTNLWTLIFAIIIASVGLNVNSTAVIIGAMLISPLMGPIMGIGLGIGINDFDLVKKGIRNLLIASVISILTSALYFWITPLHEAQSELLARTTPSIWDVFIAIAGGLAGIIGATRKEKSNVIPGVAIATALMPPLCTAGYGLATGNFYYFFGALYLYSINSVFICISTFLIIRLLRFKRKQFDDKKYERKISRYILITILITILPSIYLTIDIVNKNIFETNARNFVEGQFQFQNTQVINKKLVYASKENKIDLLLIGEELSQKTIDSISRNMLAYGLKKTKLLIKQGFHAKQEIDFSQIKASILEDVLKKDSITKRQVQRISPLNLPLPDIQAEMKVLYPGLKSYILSNSVIRHVGGMPNDTLTLIVADFVKPLKTKEKMVLQSWLKTRLQADSVKLVIE